ncbi:MAG: type II secretion system protein [Akkermansiaceae bacterium]|nr:type II secretion system protein [Akkermansiaceae bacterium]
MHKSPVRLSRRPGFTLVELLVVIAIVAVLAALTFTVVTKLVAKARTASSVNNLKQIHIGAESFAMENFGIFPSTTWGHAKGVDKAYWWNYLGPYIYNDYQGKLDGLVRDKADPAVRAISDSAFRTPKWGEISYTPWDNLTVSPHAQLPGISTIKTKDLAGQPYMSTALNNGYLRACDGREAFEENVLPTAQWRNNQIIVIYCNGSVQVIKNPTYEKVAPAMPELQN